MTATRTPKPRLTPQDTRREFFEAVQTANPFAVNRISDPSQMQCDVETIHATAFRRLFEGAQDAFEAGRGVGALLLGSGHGQEPLTGPAESVGRRIKPASCICTTSRSVRRT